MPYYASDEEIEQLQQRLTDASRDIDDTRAERIAKYLRHEYGSAAIDVVTLVLAAERIADENQD